MDEKVIVKSKKSITLKLDPSLDYIKIEFSDGEVFMGGESVIRDAIDKFCKENYSPIYPVTD